jgi:hypothetical protein
MDETDNFDTSSVARNRAEPVGPSQSADRAARRALLISFGVISVVGGVFVLGCWRSVSAVMALERCAAFIGVMMAVHFIGYRLWRRQSARAPMPPESVGTITTGARRLGTPASIVLLIVGTGYLLLLDGQVFTNSLVFLACATASLAIWVSNRGKPRGTGSLLMIALHAGIICLVLLALPANFRWQKAFNEKRKERSQTTQQMRERQKAEADR